MEHRKSNSVRNTLAFLGLLAICEYFVFFRNSGHFFQADTLFWFDHRSTSLAEFLRGFTRADASGWYRPLTNQSIQSLLYPFFHLRPEPYRWVLAALFLANTLAVYTLIRTLTSNAVASALGTTFFAFHTVNAITTYDLAFVPELSYTLFYVAAAVTFVQYLRSSRKRYAAASVVLFAASLGSKEGSVSLPATLVALAALEGCGVRRILRSIAPHLALLAIYAVFVIGHLHAPHDAARTLFDESDRTQANEYRLAFNRTTLSNASLAVSWAFNLPRGWMAVFRHASPGMLSFLKAFRALAVMLIVWSIVTPRRCGVLAGLLWFFIALAPALPLVGHFFSYYLFLPLAGLSLAIGAAFANAVDAARERNPLWGKASLAGVILIVAASAAVAAHGIQHEMRENTLMGWSADRAQQSIEDVSRLHPSLPPGATLYFLDNAWPELGYVHGGGGLFRSFYNDPQLRTLYATGGDALPKELAGSGKLYVFRWENGRLIETANGSE